MPANFVRVTKSGRRVKRYPSKMVRVRKAPTKGASFRDRVKKIIQGESEVKHNYFAAQVTAPISKTFYYLNMLDNIAQNDTVTGREGNTIHLSAVRCQMRFHNGSELNNSYFDVWYRVLLVKHKAEITTTGVWGSGGAITQSTVYQNNNTFDGVDGNVDAAKCTVLFDELVHLEPMFVDGSGVVGRVSKSKNFTVKLDTKYQYQDGTNYGLTTNRNYYWIVIPFNENGSSDTGKFTLCSDLIFKDL